MWEKTQNTLGAIQQWPGDELMQNSTYSVQRKTLQNFKRSQMVSNKFSQLRNPVKMVDIEAKMATSNVTRITISKVHIYRQHVQLLRPKQLLLYRIQMWMRHPAANRPAKTTITITAPKPPILPQNSGLLASFCMTRCIDHSRNHNGTSRQASIHNTYISTNP